MSSAQLKRAEDHNAAIQPLIMQMWRAADRHPEALMVLTESLLVGVCAFIIKLGGDNAVLDVMVDRARERLSELRLTDIQPEGRG